MRRLEYAIATSSRACIKTFPYAHNHRKDTYEYNNHKKPRRRRNRITEFSSYQHYVACGRNSQSFFCLGFDFIYLGNGPQPPSNSDWFTHISTMQLENITKTGNVSHKIERIAPALQIRYAQWQGAGTCRIPRP